MDVESSVGRETILLVEDEEGLRVLARMALESAGYNVLAAANGRQALEIWESHAIAILVTDVSMPKMSGCELAERLKMQRPELKILFLSGYSHEVVSDSRIPEEDMAFLEKPFRPIALISTIRELLK